MVGGSYSIIHPTDECSACCEKYVMLLKKKKKKKKCYTKTTQSIFVMLSLVSLFKVMVLKFSQNPPIITTRKIIFLETDNPQTKNKTFGNKVLYYEPMMQKTIEVASLICNLK